MRHARWIVVICALVGCQDAGGTRDVLERGAPLLALTVDDQTRDAFSLPIAGLSERRRAAFFVGNSLFNQNWVAAPATVSERDGLGPLFNARSCSGCHFKDGRGAPQLASEPQRGVLLRIAILHEGKVQPHPEYGDQLQSDALPGQPPEVRIATRYRELPGRYADGEAYSLREPSYVLSAPAYGPLPEQLLISARVAPATIGLGLLEAVPEGTLAALEDATDRDHDGISGHISRLPDGSLGRFGWKAEQPTVRAQVAAAFVGDMGITSSLFSKENHSQAQIAHDAFTSGGTPELSDPLLDAVESYMRTLAVPAARSGPGFGGGRLFTSAGCPSCHLPTLRTGHVADIDALSNVVFAPYTDLLLHDMGEGLSDQRPSGGAVGSEWRTAPLWGIGLIPKVNGHSYLLHDGRARGVAEAILWHGGEAQRARDAFVRMTRDERSALVAFVESL